MKRRVKFERSPHSVFRFVNLTGVLMILLSSLLVFSQDEIGESPSATNPLATSPPAENSDASSAEKSSPNPNKSSHSPEPVPGEDSAGLPLPTDLPSFFETHDLSDKDQIPPKVEIVVDSSGSMGQLLSADKSKMYYTKKLLERYLMDQWKEKAIVALRVYGSRRRHDCKDNTLSVEFGEKSLENIEKKIKRLHPVGMTPLQDSLEAAIKDIQSYKGPKRIILFTDGFDTCGGDPCKTGELIQKNPAVDIKIYVVAIGFDAESQKNKNLNCLGSVTQVNSQDDLFNALGNISNAIKTQNNLVVESPQPTAQVQLFRIVNGKPVYYRTFTSAWGIRVPPGQYSAKVLFHPAFEFPPFTIPPHKKIHLVVRGKGTIHVGFRDQILNVELLNKDSQVVSEFKSDQDFLAETGKYKLRLFRKPLFDKVIPEFFVFPNGYHKYDVSGVGVVQFDHPSLAGYYVYDHKKRFVGNYLTNTPLVLKNGVYIFHLNEKCSFESVGVNNSEQITRVQCPQ